MEAKFFAALAYVLVSNWVTAVKADTVVAPATYWSQIGLETDTQVYDVAQGSYVNSKLTAQPIITTPGNLTASVPQGTVSAAGSVTLSMTPSISASLTVGASPIVGNFSSGVVNANISYQMMIVGDPVFGRASVQVKAHGTTTATISSEGVNNGSAAMGEQLSIRNSFETPLYNSSYLQPTAGSPQSMTGGITEDGTYNFLLNSPYIVEMALSLTAGFYTPDSFHLTGGSIFLSAFLDPEFILVGPNADQFRIELSPNVQNGIAAVPEPSTWLMMVAGFGSLIFLIHRRRRSTARPLNWRSQRRLQLTFQIG